MKIWFTLTGTSHYFGSDFLEKGMKIRLEKEPDNRYDREAIKVLLDGVGHIGYVANSPYTVLGESFSAGRLYDRIGDTAKGKVQFVTDRGVLCTLKRKKDNDLILPKACAPEDADCEKPGEASGEDLPEAR